MCTENGFAQIEGYLSSEEAFNGVLFVLKEPNAEEQGCFWFRERLRNGFSGDDPGSPAEKRVFSRMRKTFETLLTYCGADLCLKDCAFANIRPQNGENRETKAYRELEDKYKVERIDSLIAACRPRFVFVCKDVFAALARGAPCCEDGVRYGNRQLKTLTRNGAVTVFEICHPSYRRISYPKRKEE